MSTSLESSRVAGFKKWSVAHKAGDNDEDPNLGYAAVIETPGLTDASGGITSSEQPFSPGLVPGVGISI
jgi:hypothetical protein